MLGTVARLRPELIAFLNQLKKNNNREWFRRNEPRATSYECQPLTPN